jgi:hypothetical protein
MADKEIRERSSVGITIHQKVNNIHFENYCLLNWQNGVRDCVFDLTLSFTTVLDLEK